jgi:hypothetical protein
VLPCRRCVIAKGFVEVFMGHMGHKVVKAL